MKVQQKSLEESAEIINSETRVVDTGEGIDTAQHVAFMINSMSSSDKAFFDGMSNNPAVPDEDVAEKISVKIGDKITQDGKVCVIVATPEEPKGYIIPDKYYCIIKELATSKKYFFKL